MKEKISLIIENQGDECLFVLKGFPVEIMNINKQSLDQIVDNKVSRLIEITQKKKPIIAFDEFICLYDFLTQQYARICVIENAAYMNLYPPDIILSKESSTALVSHFDPDADEEIEIGQISDYTQVYSNFISTDHGFAACYNINDYQLKNEKIERIIIEPETTPLSFSDSSTRELQILNICDDKDYFQLVRELNASKDSFVVSWDCYATSEEIVRHKLEFLNSLFPNRIFEHKETVAAISIAHNDDIAKLLKKYWGYEKFRHINMYDVAEAQKGNKKVISISQEQIVNDLVEQTNRCVSGESFRDIFVTAPTGSGKSIMFQLPAMYLAEKYNLLTLVITPLIGLMNDQVQALNKLGYTEAKTINSDIPPIKKQEILEEVAAGKCHILYLSPESLLSRSDIEQLIGSRRIGMLVVDEAHIVSTWGKQFRPDYWYLGDHVQKLRRTQASRDVAPSPFIIATFTATAIFEGHEDMYHETLNSLHMIDPITYLGYVKRDNISIEIKEVDVRRNKVEYEINKFDALIEMIKPSIMRSQKTLIYFPTVALINRFHDYCYSKDIQQYVAKYHGQMAAEAKEENFRDFLNGRKLIMIATKAFGMGIDIPDIAIVSHFAPTGNVCDYMQEIGRAARDKDISGRAIYQHMSNDFKHINRLHGLSAIQRYQLVEVIKKILEIYTNTRYKNGSSHFTKKRNEMLVDAESFSYIFDSPQSDENDLINKVKTAMLLIQKDYENRGFAPFYMRPVPLFAFGYFSLTPFVQNQLNRKFPDSIKLIHAPLNVCEVNLKKIWDTAYSNKISFPKFKFLLYTKSNELDFNKKYTMNSAMSVEIFFDPKSEEKFRSINERLKKIINQSIFKGNYLSNSEIIDEMVEGTGISRFKAESIIGVVIAAMAIYQREYSGRLNTYMYKTSVTRNGTASYNFLPASRDFFGWLQKNYLFITKNTNNNQLYAVNEGNSSNSRELTTAMGVMESYGILRFKSLGGSNSQIYIYVNETKNMQIVRDKPTFYKNKLLELINQRHEQSVRMLTYLFQSKFSSDQIWDHLENYFLGILPKEILEETENVLPDSEEISIEFIVGDELKKDYANWDEAKSLFGKPFIEDFITNDIPMADYYAAKLKIGEVEADVNLAWLDKKIALTDGEEDQQFRDIAVSKGWICVPIDNINIADFNRLF